MSNTRTLILQSGDRRLTLPVNPKQMIFSRSQNTREFLTISGETLHAAGGVGLLQGTLETFLPGGQSRFYTGTPPKDGISLLRRWESEGTPVRVLLSGTDIDDWFLICCLREILAEGDEDIGVSISLKEYRYITLREESSLSAESAGGLSARADQRSIPARCVVREGDTLWSIALRYYGAGEAWKTLARRNGLSAPEDLTTGKELYLI